MHVISLTRTNRQSVELKRYLGEKSISICGSFRSRHIEERSVGPEHARRAGQELYRRHSRKCFLGQYAEVFGFNSRAESERNDVLQRERTLLYVTA